MGTIKRISVEVMLTILKEICIHGKLKRTKLSMYSKLPYDRFKKYLFMMNLLNLVCVVSTSDGIFVEHTELGKNFLDTLSTSEYC
jgi:predicted transcriptional regulator